MIFPERTLKPYAEPVDKELLVVGVTYFAVTFLDDDMLIPELRPIVFLGEDLAPEFGDGMHCFQDQASYSQGQRFEDPEQGEAQFFFGGASEIHHVFEFEKALDLLLECSLRRGTSSATG